VKNAVLFFSLLAMPAALVAADNQPRDFKVTEAAKRMVPLAKDHAVGEEFTLKEYEPALVGGIGFRGVTKLDSPVTVSIGGVAWTVGAQDLLIEMQDFSGGDSASLPGGSVAYCDLKRFKPRNPKARLRRGAAVTQRPVREGIGLLPRRYRR
jgi:hypothetical protein